MQLYAGGRVANEDHARLPNTTQWLAHTKRGDYLVQVAWPLSGNEDRTGPEDDTVSTMFVINPR